MVCIRVAKRQDEEVWRQLDRVNDPELDEPITTLGFVEKVTVTDEERVDVQFRLPTYWCSPNFAFLMADGIRREVSALPWVARVVVRLEDHMHADEVNEGVNSGRSFAEIFDTLSNGEGLETLRAKFDEKAFQRRQEVILLALRTEGYSDLAISVMRLTDFDALVLTGDVAAFQKPRYREILLVKGLADAPDDLAFRTYDGAALTEESLPDYLATLRGVRINMEFNGALCRGLLKTRYKEADLAGDEPDLVDFILDRVPPRPEAGAPPG